MAYTVRMPGICIIVLGNPRTCLWEAAEVTLPLVQDQARSWDLFSCDH